MALEQDSAWLALQALYDCHGKSLRLRELCSDPLRDSMT